MSLYLLYEKENKKQSIKGYIMEEKRGHRRYPVLSFPFFCSKCDSRDVEININDISCSGLRILTNEKMYRGGRVKLEIVLPADDIPMFVDAIVKWVKKDPDNESAYHVGVHLNDLKPYNKERLVRHINMNFGSRPGLLNF